MIGRNDTCWCGSGKKYKKCHMDADSTIGESQILPPLPKYAKDKTGLIGMKLAGEANGELMDYIRPFVQAGVTTGELDRLVNSYTISKGYVPACLGYHGFPKSCCISVNNVVCHGIPGDSTILRDGDIVNVDLTTIVNGYYGDSSETFFIGEPSQEARHLVDVTLKALLLGISAVSPGKPLGDIGRAIEPFVKSHGCSVVRQYTGHGIGKKFHERYTVYHHIAPEADTIIMNPGMTFTIEPMINLGDYHVVTDRHDKWTVRTKDGSLSAQFEHTVTVTFDGCEILTLTPSQKNSGKTVVVAGL